MKLKYFALGGVVGIVIGWHSLIETLEFFKKKKRFIYGFIDNEKSTNDKIIFNMYDFEGSFVLEYNKKVEVTAEATED